MASTILWQRVEGACLFLLSLWAYLLLVDAPSWGWALLIFFAPDLSFLAYPLGPAIGAAIYNLCHLYALGAAVAATGLALGQPFITVTGLLLFAHAGFDRALGYGLKAPQGFHETHLGRIGRK